MSDNPHVRTRLVLFWITTFLVAGVVVGFSTGGSPAIESFLRPSLGVIMIVAGLVLLSPFAISRPTNEQQRRSKGYLSVFGAAAVLQGAAHVVPNAKVSVALMVAALLLIATAIWGFRRNRRVHES